MNMRKNRWILLTTAILCTGCLPNGLLIKPVSTNDQLVETTLRTDGRFSIDKIAVIDVDGVIMNLHEPRLIGKGEHSVSRLLEQLDKARSDPHVKAVILRINSPGGSVTASELMHDEITHFKKSGKPIVAMMMDLAASGGYHIACACDRICANRSTVTGSIGVIMQLFDLTGTMRLIGVKPTAIVSGDNKAAGSPFEELTPQQRDLFQSMIDDMYERFLEVVDKGRPELTIEQIRTLADGRVYTAPQALEAGLIDEITTMRNLISDLKRKTGSRRIKLVAYARPYDFVPNYYAKTPKNSPDMNLIDIDAALEKTTPRFMYVWAP
jgi:protease-4